MYLRSIHTFLHYHARMNFFQESPYIEMLLEDRHANDLKVCKNIGQQPVIDIVLLRFQYVEEILK